MKNRTAVTAAGLLLAGTIATGAAQQNAVTQPQELYGEHLGAGSIPVALTGNSPQPAPTQRIVDDLPRTSTGSPTYPLDMVAALSADHKFLTLAVVNATDSERKFDLAVDGVRLSGNATLWRMTGNNLETANKVGQPPQVEIKQTAIGEAPATLSVAPISVDIYRFPVIQTAP